MTIIESLKPRKNQKVLDLVRSAGGNVAQWADSRKGKVRYPASNPAYVYEWAFIETGFVILNVWHDEIQESGGVVWCAPYPKAYSETARNSSNLSPSQRSSISKRAGHMDAAIRLAFENNLPIRLIIGAGSRRDLTNSDSKASRMKLRLLDPEPWFVERYDFETGGTRLRRGTRPRYIDQFKTPEGRKPNRKDSSGSAWDRDRRIRDAALSRAGGKCEHCNGAGFKTVKGDIYLETHHVIPLSEGGFDEEWNVVALCPNDHREAHHGERREAIRTQLLEFLSKQYGTTPE